MQICNAIFTIIFLVIGASGEFIDTSLKRHETFKLADIDNYLEISGKGTSEFYEKTFQFNPDTNRKRGHMLVISDLAYRALIHISEFTLGENGTIDRTIERPGVSDFGAKSYYAPSTGIMIRFSINKDLPIYDDETENGVTFGATISTTPTNHHCPYPFIDLLPDVNVVLEDTFITYSCDAKITAPPGYDVRIDHIRGAINSSELDIRALDDESNQIETFVAFPVQETSLGVNPLIISVWKKGDYDHHVEIQVSTVKLNCTCGPREFIFNGRYDNDYPIFRSPDYPKNHCRMVPCQRTFSISTKLRMTHKIYLEPFEPLTHGFIEIDQGLNGITTRLDRLTRYSFFETSTVTLKYIPEGKRYGDVFEIWLGLVNRRPDCECPHQSKIASEFHLNMSTHCEYMDCLYEIPPIDDGTLRGTFEFKDPDEYFGIRFIGQRSEKYVYTNMTDTIYEHDTTSITDPRMIFHYHKGENRVDKGPSRVRLFYTTNGTHISHAERCGCTNTTIVLQSTQSLQFDSPNWPSHYCNNLVCTTTYVAPDHHHIEVKLDKISLEPDRDRVAFFEGTNISAKHIKFITGEMQTDYPISSSGSVMTTVFISNGAVSFDGFNGTITAVMDKKWAAHLKHRISAWWWFIAAFFLFSVVGTAIFVWKRRGGLLRSPSINLLDL